MKTVLLNTDASWAPTLSRLFLGTVLFPHGAQKLLGWFGGYGFSGTMHFFTNTLGLPWLLGFSVIAIEFFGALFLLLGLYTRATGLLVFGLFAGILFTSHLHYGFFMNWMGNQKGEGMEYFFLLFGLALSLVVSGGGKLSVDRHLSRLR